MVGGLKSGYCWLRIAEAFKAAYPKTVSLYIGVPCDIPHVGQIHVSSDDHGWAWQFRAQRNPARVRWIDLPVEGSAAA